ncbi:hypothetical protein V8C43DRAFT_299090 [Trichoderma afarasin]
MFFQVRLSVCFDVLCLHVSSVARFILEVFKMPTISFLYSIASIQWYLASYCYISVIKPTP